MDALTLFKHDIVCHGAQVARCSKRVFSEVLFVQSVDRQYNHCLLSGFL